MLIDTLQYAPYKDSKKLTLAAKAKEIGLEGAALDLLNGAKDISFESLIDVQIEGRESVKSIQLGIQHVMADVIGKSKENIDKMNELYVTFTNIYTLFNQLINFYLIF